MAKSNPEVFEEGSHDLHYAEHSLIMYAHVILGIIYLLSGAFQLTPYLRNNYIHVHRWVGRVFLCTSLLLSSSAIVMALFFPFGDRIESITNLVFGVFIMFCTVKAYTSIKQKQILEHSYWVRRIFFLSLAIASIRLVMIFGIIVFDSTVKEVMGISFLIGFLIHLAIIEWWIKQHKKRSQILRR